MDSTNPPLQVVAILRAREGREEELFEVARALLEPTRAEAGCLRYELFRDSGDPTRLVFVETWASRAHLDAHLETPHLQHARARYDELLDGDLELLTGHESGPA